MNPAPASGFRRAAILGTGLIGGSFGLALAKCFPEIERVGWDREDVLRQAKARGAISEAAPDLARAVADADLIYAALPIGLTLELLPQVSQCAKPGGLVTDTCSTKRAVCSAAEKFFRGEKRFLGGHPMAGKELSGIAYAEADLFRGAKYALIAAPDDPQAKPFAELVTKMGGRPVWMDAETHDWAAAIVSHLPQLLAVALAGVVREETDETGLPLELAGGGLRGMLRLAGSPYPIWRDIALTNTDNLDHALDRVIQALDHLRTRLRSKELADEFSSANDIYKLLRDLQ